ncbi:DNA-3-methyladenine glycosylase 2 family protein [Aeromicrobium sp. YIM 150415]|uniref:DNA-3-methyladenine glycosylase family protein n=1 Tax=Aeromicrobium sp. YIM 150415 TaxID=2803912 RepID=UPI001965747B|nr:DNA-3-methyladenine glycosylase 2 family protein [Aeromicrobium sp. YIM 150415]MBM9462546.1 DNA-3-methyladenine glycosylase 2 family protein [Aeromicrobium sp. YIM 150415]
MTLHIELPGRYDLHRSLSPLRRGPYDPTFRRRGDEIWNAVRSPEGPATLRLRQLTPALVEADVWGPGAEWAAHRLPELLGAADDPESFTPSDALLADLHRRTPGLRLPRTLRVLDALVPAIIEQKVLGVDAFNAWSRILRHAGTPAPGPAPAGLLAPPDATGWSSIPAWEWHRAGVGPQRYRAIQAAVRVGERLQQLPSERLPAGLSPIPGVGRWTIAETIVRVHGDSDAVPWGDYHLGRLVGTALAGRIVDDDATIAHLLAPYAPHRYRALRLLALHIRVPRRGPRRARVDYRAH